jgi:phenylalanyl-tRNA synthetase beta chain
VLTLRASRIARVLGTDVPDADVPARLEPLGFAVEMQRPTSAPGPRTSDLGPRTSEWRVTVPAFRVDVQREIDLIEEVARHDGYRALPATFPEMTAAQPPPDPGIVSARLIRHVLTACGLSEAMTFAFIEADAAAPFAASAEDVVAVANPLSEKFAVLRPSLLPGLVDAAAHNRRRQHPDVRLFETGVRFDRAAERRSVAGVWAGAGTPAHWSGGARAVDFFDVKGVVETLARAFGTDIVCEAADVPYLVPGKSASVSFGAQANGAHGVIGQVQPAVLEARGFPAGETLWAFELDAGALAGGPAAADALRAESLPRFPSVVRDLSILVDASLPAAAVRGTIRSSAPATLAHVIEFDRYKGKGVPDDRVSLSLRLTFRSPERTLTDGEVDTAMDGIVKALGERHGAVRR